MWPYINPEEEPSKNTQLVTRPNMPAPGAYQEGVTEVEDLEDNAYIKYSRAVKRWSYEYKQWMDQEHVLMELTMYLNELVDPTHYWVFWRKNTLKDKIKSPSDGIQAKP